MIFKEVKQILCDNLTAISKLNLTYHAAHMIVHFGINLLYSQKPRLESHRALNLQMSMIADSLFNFNKNVHFSQDCDELFSNFV